MAKVPASGVRLFVAQYDLSGFLNVGEMSVEQETPVVTTFSDAGPRRLVGTYDHTVNQQGYFDAATLALDPAVWAALGNTAGALPVAQLFAGIAEGGIVYESLVEIAEQMRTAAIGEAVVMSLAGNGAGHLCRATLLRLATVTGTGNGTGRNTGTTAAGQTFAAVFRVVSGTFTSLTLRVQESQNDGGADPYADIAGLTATFTVAGWQRLTTTAATETWKRAVVQAFTGTNAVIVVTAGRVAE